MCHFGEKDDRVEGPALVLGSDVKMFACGSTCGASDAYGEAGENGLTLGGKDSGEVAVADAEVAVADGDGGLSYVPEEEYTEELWNKQKKAAGRAMASPLYKTLRIYKIPFNKSRKSGSTDIFRGSTEVKLS